MTDKQKGVTLVVSAALFFALIAVMVKLIEGIPSTEKLFFRALFGWIFITCFMCRKHISFKSSRKKTLIVRGFAGFCGGFLNYLALSNAPMAEVVTLCNLYPFFVILLSMLFLKERINRYHIIALFLSFLGVLCVTRPGFSDLNAFYMVALASSIFTAVAHTLIKTLRNTESPELVVFYFCAMSTLCSAAPMMLGHFVMPTAVEWGQLVLLGLFATGYQACISCAYKFAPVGELTIYSYTTIIFSAVFGILLWNERLLPATCIGIAVILAGGYVLFIHEKGESAEKAVEETDES